LKVFLVNLLAALNFANVFLIKIIRKIKNVKNVKNVTKKNINTSMLQPAVGNENLPKIIINNTINYFLNCNQHSGNFIP